MTDAEVWFLTGSQSLYGPETLEQVADQSRRIAVQLDGHRDLALRSGRPRFVANQDHNHRRRWVWPGCPVYGWSVRARPDTDGRRPGQCGGDAT